MSSFCFKDVYLKDYYTVAGNLEAKGTIKNYDLIINDYHFNEKTFEKAESKMQQTVLNYLLSKDKKSMIVVGGDLSNQLSIMSKTLSKYPISYLGNYSACATFVESLINLSLLIDSKKIKEGIAITSSHNKVSERQFRYPVEYGSPIFKRSTYTATGAAGCILTKEKQRIKVESATIGRVIDYNIVDSQNMGAVMAPAAKDTLINHLNDLEIDINYYDVILTGDLGVIGSSIFKDLLKIDHGIKMNNHLDAGSILYKKEQKLGSGSSGPVTLPLVLFNRILKEKQYKKILLLATGSLHSKTLVDQKETIPSICHAISLEVIS